MYFSTILIALSLVYSSHESTKTDKIKNDNTLQLVHVFFRHGSRTPEFKDVYPNDPYKQDDFQPMGWGQLTNVGKARAYKLGLLLRKTYNSFLGELYTPEIVDATSTDFDRTKMSALLVLAGLFKPAPSQIWDDEVSWLPIPYNYEKADADFSLRRPSHYCPTYNHELAEVLSSYEAQHLMELHKSTLNYISSNTGLKMKTLHDVLGIYQTLNAEENLNFTLPNWTKNVTDTITHLAGKLCDFENYNDVLKKLNGGRMLGKIINNMVAKSKNLLEQKNTKLFLYSGHENNVINILAALNLFEPHVPKYSAAVIIELHYLREAKQYAVKVYYSRDVDAEPEEQKLEGCDVLCPLQQFIEITRPHVPVNYTAECHSNINLD